MNIKSLRLKYRKKSSDSDFWQTVANIARSQEDADYKEFMIHDLLAERGIDLGVIKDAITKYNVVRSFDRGDPNRTKQEIQRLIGIYQRSLDTATRPEVVEENRELVNQLNQFLQQLP